MNQTKLFLVFFLFEWIVALSGCATLSENQCRMQDWYGVGMDDGLQGYRSDRMTSHQKACAEYGVMVDRGAYLKGYKEGLRQFCIPANGYTLGRQGKSYYGVCTGPEAKDFQDAYNQGKWEHDVEDRLDDVEREILDVEDQMRKKDISRKERDRLITEIRELERERTYLRVMRNQGYTPGATLEYAPY